MSQNVTSSDGRSETAHGIFNNNRARQELINGLRIIPWIKVFPSQANYVMCELINGHTSIDLCAALLKDHNILIKDLSRKVNNGKQYIRIAVRTTEDNETLIRALKEY